MTEVGRASLLRLDEAGSWSARHWTGLACSIGIAAINGYVWTLTGMPQFLAIAASFGIGVGLFLTRFWNPALYLVGAVHVLALGVVWLLDGRPRPLLGAVTGALSVGLLWAALSLFLSERPADDG